MNKTIVDDGMAPDVSALSHTDEQVMAAVDDVDDESMFIIADVSRDDAWIAIHTTEAQSLVSWC